MIVVLVFLLIFFIALSAAYAAAFSLFLTALSERGFPQDESLEAKTDYFLLYLGGDENNTITFAGGDM